MNRLDPRDVKVADVYKAGRRAATLTRDGAVNTFAYLPDYDGPAVATTLPLDSAPVSSGSSARRWSSTCGALAECHKRLS